MQKKIHNVREELPLPLFELRVSCPMLQVRPLGTVNVIVMMRLVWRKGTHLLVEIIPEICRRFPYVHFIIGGDGPNRGALEEMRERDQLQERVELLGAVPHCDVPSVLTVCDASLARQRLGLSKDLRCFH